MHYSELGYKEYDEYLEGKEWQQLKNFFYAHCGPYRCGVCKAPRGLLLHKRTYEFLTLMKLRKKYWFIHPLVVRWLKKHFVWLCREHNGQIHFYDNGSRVPLTYKDLVAREKVVRRRYKWKLILGLKPSDILRAIGSWLSIYSV